jgi:hypothetical protein
MIVVYRIVIRMSCNTNQVILFFLDQRSLFWAHGIRIVRYADDFVLMGRTLPTQAIEKLKELIERMGLRINEKKTR